MNSTYLVLFIASLTVAHAADAGLRIVGGESVAVGRYPYMVGLHDSSLGSPFCGGSLIAPNVVLTAAHCINISKLVSVGRMIQIS